MKFKLTQVEDKVKVECEVEEEVEVEPYSKLKCELEVDSKLKLIRAIPFEKVGGGRSGKISDPPRPRFFKI